MANSRLYYLLQRDRECYSPNDDSWPCEKCSREDLHYHYPGDSDPSSDWPPASPLNSIISYAIIRPGEKLQWGAGTLEGIRDITGHGHGNGPTRLANIPTLRAYVCQVPGINCTCKANPIGQRMIDLLGGGGEDCPGPIVFVQLAHPLVERAFTSFTEASREILELAATTART